MRILFATDNYPPEIGGVAASAGRISKSLARMGHTVEVLVLARDLPAGLAERHLLDEQLIVHRFGRSKNIDFTLQQATIFLEWLDRQSPFDLIWGHYLQTAGFLAAWLGRLWKRRSVVAVRGNDLDRLLFPPGDFARLRWCLESASQIVTVTADLAAKVEALVGRTAQVVPNSVDASIFTPGEKPADLLERYAIRPEEVVLVFSGELRAKKGLVFLIHALRELAQRRPVRLVVIGEVRPKEQGDYQTALASTPELANHITITGHIPHAHEVARHLRLADVFLLPSLWEGMPNGLLEAMAAGVPVLASDAGGIAEVLVDRESGFVVPRTHLHHLAPRVEEILAMTGARRKLITDFARQKVLTAHSLAAEEAALAKVLEMKEVSTVAKEG